MAITFSLVPTMRFGLLPNSRVSASDCRFATFTVASAVRPHPGMRARAVSGPPAATPLMRPVSSPMVATAVFGVTNAQLTAESTAVSTPSRTMTTLRSPTDLAATSIVAGVILKLCGSRTVTTMLRLKLR